MTARAEFATFPDDALLTAPEVAKYLRVGKDAAYALCRDGIIPVTRVGNQYRVPFWALKTWVAQQTNYPYPQPTEAGNVAALRH